MNVRESFALARRAFAAWSGDYAPSMGAALAYYALFSIAPLLLILTGVAGFFFGAQAARGELFGQLAGLMGDEAARAIEGLLAHADRPASGIIAMALGGVTLLFGASTVFNELQSDLDRIWRSPASASGWRGMARSRLLALLLIMLLAVLLIGLLAASALLSALAESWAAHLADAALSLALVTLGFALVYKIVPRVRIAWRDVWMGAMVTAALFVAGKFLIGVYLGRAAPASAFGAAGSLVVLMVWVYYSAQIFLLGAEFTRLYAHEHGSRTAIREPANDERAFPPAPAPAAPQGGRSIVKIGTALALGAAASIGLRFGLKFGLRFWRR
jgi:membrane protein